MLSLSSLYDRSVAASCYEAAVALYRRTSGARFWRALAIASPCAWDSRDWTLPET